MSEIRRTLARTSHGLLLTYNWGSIEWELVNTIGRMTPHVHFESGFGSDEADRQIGRRIWMRRIALRGATRIVVPSHTLLDIVTNVWKLDELRVQLIPTGVNCVRFAVAPEPAVIAGFAKRPGELIVGTLAPLRPEKNLGRLIRAFAALPRDVASRLLIIGDGAERERLESLVRALGLADRAIFSGYLAMPEKALGLIDVFAMSSDTEQMPNTLIQAMAAGRAIAATDIGDTRRIVAVANHPLIVARDEDSALTRTIDRLLSQPDLRAAIGAANRARVREHYDQERMVAAYDVLYRAALGVGAERAAPAEVEA